jgi:RNA polymerase sigma factor (sigma-70 family)
MSPRPRIVSPHTRHAPPGAGGSPPTALDFDLTPDLETMLNALARAGRDDPAARNELYARLSGKIARFLAPWRGRQTALGDFADLQQEAFLIFATMVEDWSGEGSFARYFFAFFPWRLRHAIAWHDRRWPRHRLAIVPQEDLRALARDDPAALSDEGRLVFGDLAPEDRRLLALRLGGCTLPDAAECFGWSLSTVARRWRALRDRLTEQVASAGR